MWGSIQQGVVLLFLIVMAFSLRCFFWRFDPVVTADGAMYTTVGYNIWHGIGYINHKGGLAYYAAPLFPLMAGFLSLFVDNIVTCGRLVSALFGSLLCLPIFFLARRMYGVGAGVFAAVVIAVLPSLIKWSAYATLEATYMFFLYMAMYSGYRTLTRAHKWDLPATGGLFGITALVRQEALIFLGVFLLLYLYHNRQTVFTRPLQMAAKVAICLAVYLAFTLPFALYMYGESGHFRLNNKTDIGLHPTKRILETGQIGLGYETGMMGLTADGLDIHNGKRLESVKVSLIELVQEYPADFSRFYASMAYLIFEKYAKRLMPLVIILLAAIGAWTTLDRKARGDFVYLACYLLPPLLLYPIFVNHERRFVPFVPILVIWAAHGLELVAMKIREAKPTWARRYRLDIALAVLIGGLLTVQGVEEAKRAFRPDRMLFEDVARWMESHSEEGLLMSRTVFVNFYRRKPHVHIPFTYEYDKFKRYAQHQGINYVLVSKNLIERNYPKYIQHLYNRSEIPPEMSFVKEWKKGQVGLVLYRFDPTNRQI